jgi:hypothetical protein
MSIAALAQQTRERVISQSSRALLKIVPETAEAVHETRRFFATFLTVVASLGFLALLVINTLLAQDAFVLSELKSDAKMIADQREAISRKMELYSSPQALADRAAQLGMSPSENPTFLDISPRMPILSDGQGVTRG